MHIFITGGAGFIGSHIAESLLISGHWLTILDNLSSGVHGNVPNHPRITFIEKDLLSYAAAEWPRDLDAVIHLAALPSVTESWIELRRVHEINLSGTVTCLGGSAAQPCPTICLRKFCRGLWGRDLTAPRRRAHRAALALWTSEAGGRAIWQDDRARIGPEVHRVALL